LEPFVLRESSKRDVDLMAS
jgi:hypothetical protein